MDINLIFGLFTMFCAFYFGVPALKESIQVFLDPTSFTLVFAGTVGATLMSTSFKEIKGVLYVFRQMIIKSKSVKPIKAVEILVHISELAQTQSKQSLATEGTGVGDGLDRDFIQKALETDISEVKQRHDATIGKVRGMGTFAPMFGMTGTVMGVTMVLQNVTDIDTIVSGMSLALLTTLYGLILSSVVFIPISNKLRGMSADELITKEIMMQGVLAIMDKEIPLKVEKYLMAYVESKAKKKK